MRFISAGSTVAALVVAIFLVRPSQVAMLDDKVCDVLTGLVSRGKPSDRVVVVEIDGRSLAQVGRWPWPRDVLGLLTRRILDRGAATVVLDMMLHEEDRGAPSGQPVGTNSEAGAASNDDVLAAAISGKPVVVGYVFQFDRVHSSSSACAVRPLQLVTAGPDEASRTGFYHPSGVLCNVPRISVAAAGEGFLNAAPDSDGRLRRLPLVMEYGGRHYPSLALAVFSVYRGASAIRLQLNARESSQLSVGSQVVRLEGPSSMRLRFRGARRTFPYVSAAGLLNESQSAASFKDKIVIVGGSAPGLQNPVATPVDALLPDVEVQATAIDNLLQGDSFHRPASHYLWELALALLAGLATIFLLEPVRSWWCALTVLGIGVATWAGCIFLLTATGLLFSPLPVTAVLACTFPVVTLLNYLMEKGRAERTERQLALTKEHAREVVLKSESRYQRLVENVNDAIIVDDAEGRLVFANRRFRQWFGLEGRDIREVVLEDYVAPEWRALVRGQHDRRMRGGSDPGHCEYEAIRPDGTRIFIEALVTNVEEGGRVVGTQAALRDITRRKRIEAQYLQAQKMESLGRLSGSIAHDFNNLLTVINGFSDLLLTRGQGDEEYLSGLKEIRAAGERAADLTRNLLSLSRKQRVQLKAADLNVVVVEAETMFGRLMGEDIELITCLSPDLGLVMADSGQLHQILMNLLINARDAMPHGGRIVIETKNIEADEDFMCRHPDFKPGAYVYLGLTDTGTGMSDEVRQHLFEPFFTTKELGKGTGLGLATIYGIVQQSAGRIEVTTRLGEGTGFHIYLPRVQTEALAHPGANGSAATLQGSGTVLVVEDQDAVRQYTCAVLEGAGYRVIQAANGPDALALAQQSKEMIHLLVTDLAMPLMNGRTLAETLKLSRPGMRVLFTSGHAEETIDSRGLIDSEMAYLPKPFSPEELTVKVREMLAKPTEAGKRSPLSG